MDNSQNRGGSFSPAEATSNHHEMFDLSSLKLFSSQANIQKIKQVLGSEASLYVVGGAVRDKLLKKAVLDIDLATNLKPALVKVLLEREGMRVVETGLKHGTVTVVFESEIDKSQRHVEITTFRNAGKNESDPFSTSILEDLAARDFTINALAYSLNESTLIDPYNGLSDLRRGVLRAVGDPSDRFLEDSLRILRMLRFGPAQGREIEECTLQAAQAKVSELSSISVERIRDELQKILISENAAIALRTAQEIGVIGEILPELLEGVGFEQNEFHVHDVFEHTLWVIDRAVRDAKIRWASLFHDIAKPRTLSVGPDGRRHFYNHEKIGAEMAKVIMHRLKFSNSDMKEISLLVNYHMRPFECGPAGVRRLMRDLGEGFDSWLRLKEADSPPLIPEAEYREQYARFLAMVEEERKKGLLPKLSIGGEDLKSLGYEEGPQMGQILRRLNEMIIDSPEINDREALLSIARKALDRG